MLNSDFTFWAHFLGFKSQNGNNRLACDTIKMVLGKICAASALELTSRSTQLELSALLYRQVCFDLTPTSL